MPEPVINNEAERRYELHTDGGTAIAQYELRGDIIAFTHTIVPAKLRGQGIAGTLIEGALADVRRRGLKMLPECAYVAGYVARHPDTKDLVADQS